MATNDDNNRLPCKAPITTFLLLLFIYILTHFSHILSSSVPPKNLFVNCFHILACSTYRLSMLHSITPTSLLHLSPFLPFPSLTLSSFYTAYSSWITLKMKASSCCIGTCLPIYMVSYLKNKNLHQHHCKNLKILEKQCTSMGQYALCSAYFDVQLLRKFLLCN